MSTAGAECPTCGRDDFSSPRGMRYHHSVAHDQPYTESKPCENCGEGVERKPTEFDDHVLCSESCTAEWLSERRNERVEVSCEQCSTTVVRKVSAAEKGRNNFCSHECAGEWKSENLTGENHPLYSRVEVSCPACGSTHEVHEHYADRDHRSYCSRECLSAGFSEQRRGRRNHNWCAEGDESFQYGPGWSEEKRQQVKERDSFRCVDCGIAETSHRNECGVGLHVHHKTPAREFDDPERRNATQNLVTLCAACHRKWENMYPLIPRH